MGKTVQKIGWGLLCGLFACASDPVPLGGELGATSLPLRPEAREVFEVGAKSRYDITWGGFLPVGEVRYEVSEVRDGDQKLLVLDAITEPSALVAAFAKIGGTSRTWIDPDTLRPRASIWVTAARKDPATRTAFFGGDGVVHSAKVEGKLRESRRSVGRDILDPTLALFLGRAIDYDALGGEARLLVVEGGDLHQMTLRAGPLETRGEGEDQNVGRPLSVETRRLDAGGQPISEEPMTRLEAFLLETPGRPLLEMRGRVPGGSVALELVSHERPGAAPLP